MIRYLCVCWICLLIFGLLTVTRVPNAQLAKTTKDDTEEELQAEREAPILKIITSSKFLILFLIASTHKCPGYYVGNSFKQIGFQGGLPDSTLTVIGSFGALFNGVSKIILATSLDYFKFKPVYCTILSAVIISLIVIQFSVHNAYAFGLCVWINYLGDGSMTSMLPVVTINIFKNRGTEVYGYMFAEFGFAAIYGVILVQLFQSSIGYNGMLVLLCVISICVTGTLTWFYEFDTPFSYSKLMQK